MSAISSSSYFSLPVAAEVLRGAVNEINETAPGPVDVMRAKNR